MITTVNVSEAKTNLTQLLGKVCRDKKRYVIQKKKKPLAVIISAEDFKVLECMEEQVDAKFLQESAEFSSYDIYEAIP